MVKPLTWNDVSFEQRDWLLGLYENNRPELAKVYPELGLRMALTSLEAKLREHRNYRSYRLKEVAKEIALPRSYSRQWLDYEVFESDDAIVIGDIEVPDHWMDMLLLAMLVGMQRGIRKLIILGDFIATDQAALNAWVNTWKHDKEATYEEALGIVTDILEELAAWFTEIIIIEGNHDDRIARKTGGEIYLGLFLRNAKFVRYSRYSYLYMRTTERGLIKLVHPDNFSSTPVSLGQQFYDVERGPNFDPFNPFKTAEKCHFVVAHTHIDQSGWSKDGVYEIHAMGTCRDATRTQYKNKGQNKHHQWSPSFMAIKDGHFTHYHFWGTNWKEVLPDLYERTPFYSAPSAPDGTLARAG